MPAWTVCATCAALVADPAAHAAWHDTNDHPTTEESPDGD